MKRKKPNYKQSILNIAGSLMHRYGVDSDLSGIKELDEEFKYSYKHVVVILLDGLGSNVLKQHLTPMDAFRVYTRKEITSVFPPTTVAATNAFLSGMPPISNGWIGWVQYFPNEDVNNVVFLNQDYYNEDRSIPAGLSEKYISYESIFQKIKSRNPSLDVFELYPSFRLDGFASFEAQVEKIKSIVRESKESLTYCYWIEPDLTEHMYGISSDKTKEMVESLNRTFETLIQEMIEDTIVVVFADHGLVDVEEIYFPDYSDLTDCLIRLPSIEPRAVNFFVKSGKKREFKKRFNVHFKGKFILFSKRRFKHLLGEGKEHAMIDRFLGDFIGVAIDKYTLRSTKGIPFQGHHAGLTTDEMMIPLVIHTKRKKERP